MLRTEAESISMVQDASCGWLCLRFSCCNNKLRSQQGVVGVFPISELRQCHAFKIKEATERILEEFCSPARPLPFSKKDR